MSPAPPSFGKRNAHTLAGPLAPTSDVGGDHAAFFAAVRAEMAEARTDRRVVVPRSFKSAFLAGLVVGCALVGFDVTGAEGADRFAGVTSALGLQLDTSGFAGGLLPAMILLGLFGGARVAAMTVILVHGLLARSELTSRTAYAVAGAGASAAFAALLLGLLGHAPAHGWPVELASGAAAGLLYRVFAGTRLA